MLGQLLDQIRDYYVSRFIDAINEHSGNDGVSIVYEPAFCNANGEVVTAGELSLPSRGDLLVIRDGAVVTTNSYLAKISNLDCTTPSSFSSYFSWYSA